VGRVSAVAQTLAAVAALSTPDPVVLIDGPSGAGKSTLADALVARWPTAARPQLVRLDDIYPGWGGLAAASEHVVAELLGPLREAGTGRWRRWNWAADRPAEWHQVRAGRPLVVEGCGALSAAAASLAQLRIWLTADDRVRKARALERDRGAFDAHWEMWDRQFQDFVRTQHPLALADVVLDGAGRKP